MNRPNEEKKRVLIFVVSYNAERFIESVLKRIPEEVWNNDSYVTEVLVIDDSSQDRTFYIAHDFSTRFHEDKVTVLYNQENQGYGGNQKIGYHYAIQKKFDTIVLLHGDGQYPPERMNDLIRPILSGEADAVFGSRMLHRKDALRGGMPIYKWLGNQILTFVQNRLVGSNLSEFHTGYRAYSVPALASIPFDCNSDYFDFDTDIIVQLSDLRKHIKEVPVPTFYGDEISRVNGIKYAYKVLMSCLESRIQKMSLFYHPKFDYSSHEVNYTSKFGFPSSHQFAYDRVKPDSKVLDLGCGSGYMAAELSKKHVKTVSVDKIIHPDAKNYSLQYIQADLDDFDFNSVPAEIDTILTLDIIEHLRSPERILRQLRERYSKPSPELILTTANVSFFLTRLSLLLGQFHYGKKGILDFDHKRLFTFSSLRRTLTLAGYQIVLEEGIPAPFPLALGWNWFSRICLSINKYVIKFSKGLFSYQIAVVARPKATLSQLLQDAEEGKRHKLAERAGF